MESLSIHPLEVKSAAARQTSLARLAWRLAGARVDAIARWMTPACRGWRWLPTAAMVGTVPFLLSFATCLPGHQIAAALLLAAACLALAREHAWLRGPATIAVAYSAHCATVIAVAFFWPERTAQVLPDVEDYWQKQVTWITTGRDPEYDVATWARAHATLLGGSSLYSFTSFGAITLYQGFYQVDLMNYYNAQLLARSDSGPRALALGWHLWSVLRGLGYVLITFEIISLAFHAVTRRPFDGAQDRPAGRWSFRAARLAAGLGLLAADAAVKFCYLETVRQELLSNLL